MWQLFSLGSTFFSALEESIDKANIVREKAIGLLNATWLRIAVYCFIAFFAALIVQGQSPHFLLAPLIILLGLVNSVNSYFYSILLQKLEVTTSGVLFNLAPLVFLVVDLFVLKKGLTIAEISGVLLLVVGGVLFLGRKKLLEKFGKEKRLAIFGMFLFNVFYVGFQNYLFQYYSSNFHIAETDFLLSMGIATLVFITIGVFISALVHKPAKTNWRVITRYTGVSVFAKTANYGGTFFLLQALMSASVSQVSAMEAFFPIMLMFLVIFLQGGLHIKMHENLSRDVLIHKIFGIVLISMGIFLVR